MPWQQHTANESGGSLAGHWAGVRGTSHWELKSQDWTPPVCRCTLAVRGKVQQLTYPIRPILYTVWGMQDLSHIVNGSVHPDVMRFCKCSKPLIFRDNHSSKATCSNSLIPVVFVCFSWHVALLTKAKTPKKWYVNVCDSTQCIYSFLFLPCFCLDSNACHATCGMQLVFNLWDDWFQWLSGPDPEMIPPGYQAASGDEWTCLAGFVGKARKVCPCGGDVSRLAPVSGHVFLRRLSPWIWSECH